MKMIDNALLTATAASLRMPGATLVTRLKVYETISPDGQRSGTPHFHFLCTEMYFVLQGSGSVELIDANGFSRVDIAVDSALVFSPGTVHRLINPNGNLVLLIVMANTGLPEHGDNLVCFPAEIMTDDGRYAETITVDTLDAAYRRRDLGVEGFMSLKSAFAVSLGAGREALRALYERAAARTERQRKEWLDIVRTGPLAEAEKSINNLGDVERGKFDYLFDARHVLIHGGEMDKLGFCGFRVQYPDPATLDLEGVQQR